MTAAYLTADQRDYRAFTEGEAVRARGTARAAAWDEYRFAFDVWSREVEPEWERQWEKLFKRIRPAFNEYRCKALGQFLDGLCELHRRRKPHEMIYLGEWSFLQLGIPPWAYWRGKKRALELKLIKVLERGGGRLARDNGGGQFEHQVVDEGEKKKVRVWRGRADGVVPGEAITHWGEQRYSLMMTDPPPKPGIRYVDPEDTVTHQLGRHAVGNDMVLGFLKRKCERLLGFLQRPPPT